MSHEQWTEVERYFNQALIPEDEHLEQALRYSEQTGLPPIQVAAHEGMLLHLLVKMTGTRSILEIGTLGGYSTIWMAKALPQNGRVITLESDLKHAEVARKNIANAGLTEYVEVRTGKALDLLPTLAIEFAKKFDFVFIDADKENNPHYFEWSLKLTHPGSVIIIDNVVRHGEVVRADSDDPHIRGVRKLIEMLAAEKRVSATVLQTVGSKGYDGFALVFVKNEHT